MSTFWTKATMTAAVVFFIICLLLLWRVDVLAKDNEALSKDLRVKTAELVQLNDDIDANRQAVEAMVEEYAKVYRSYQDEVKRVRSRETEKMLRSEPTQAGRQIEREINAAFKNIERLTM